MIQFRPGGATTAAATSGKTASRIRGRKPDIRADVARIRRAKARMKVRRYKANGTIQRKGTDPTLAAI